MFGLNFTNLIAIKINSGIAIKKPAGWLVISALKANMIFANTRCKSCVLDFSSNKDLSTSTVVNAKIPQNVVAVTAQSRCINKINIVPDNAVDENSVAVFQYLSSQDLNVRAIK